MEDCSCCGNAGRLRVSGKLFEHAGLVKSWAQLNQVQSCSTQFITYMANRQFSNSFELFFNWVFENHTIALWWAPESFWKLFLRMSKDSVLECLAYFCGQKAAWHHLWTANSMICQSGNVWWNFLKAFENYFARPFSKTGHFVCKNFTYGCNKFSMGISNRNKT